MAAKVQCKSYFPGYYSMRDLNEEANSHSWPLYYEDKSFKSRQYGFFPRPTTNGYLEDDKEMLKQTILEHEAIFKNQVSELHRLYRVQRELMDEFRRKQLHKYPIQVEESQSNQLPSQMTSEVSQKMWHIPSSPLVNSAYCRPSVPSSENMQSPLNFIKDGNIPSGTIPTQNGGSFKDCELLESKSKKLPRRTFDLQLPADEYIDSEEEEWIKQEKVSQESVSASSPLKKNCVDASESAVKLSLGNGGNPVFRGDTSQADACSQNKYFLADMNVSIQVEKATSSAFDNNFKGPNTCHWEFQGKDLRGKPNQGFVGMPKEFFQNTETSMDKGTHINIMHSENETSKREWLFHNLEAGQSKSKLNVFSQGFCSEKSPTSSKPIQVELNKPHELPAFHLTDPSKRELGSESSIRGIGISKGSQSSHNYNFQGPVEAPLIPSSYPVIPNSAVANFGSPWVLSSRNLMNSMNQNPIAAQLSESSKMSDQIPGHLSSNLRSNSSSGKNISYRNGFCHGPHSGSKELLVHFRPVGYNYLNCNGTNTSATEHLEDHSPAKYFKGSDCLDVKSAKDINLNLALPNRVPEGMVVQRDLVIIDGEGKKEDPLGGLPWQRTKLACDDGPSKRNGSSNQQGIEVGYCPSNKKIFGFSIFEKPHVSKNQSSVNSPTKSPSEVEAIHNNGKVDVLDTDLSHDPIPNINKDLSGFRNHINLNSRASEDEAPLTSTAPMAIVKIVTEIDLEVPTVPETAESTSEKLVITSFQSSQVEEQDPSEELVRVAAEAMVIISSSNTHNHLGDATCEPSEASLRDSLHWFSEVVSSYMGDLDGKEGVEVLKGMGSGDYKKSSSDEIDYFESMTLKLTETKVGEYGCKPWTLDNQKEEETCASSLPTRRRRGQARRGRQRRDFQRDILPGLASLSRHEVTEDLQMIGGLMRATGQPWQTGLARRNAARNGCARGRRRSQGPGHTMEAKIDCSPPRQQPDNSELGLGERSLKGWGKTTRRPRRQRFAIGNHPPHPYLPVTQV